MSLELHLKGLRAILAQIRENPDDVVLGERYLSLVADMADHDQEKAAALLGFAMLLAPKDYDRALTLAYDVYQFQPDYALDALETIAEIFEGQGNAQAAVTIRGEIQKLTEIESQTQATQLAPKQTISIPAPVAPPAVVTAPLHQVQPKISDPQHTVSDEKMYKALIRDHIEAKRYVDAEDLLLKLEASSSKQQWWQDASNLVRTSLAEEKTPKPTSSVKQKSSTEFLFEVSTLLNEGQARRALLALRRYILFTDAAESLSPEVCAQLWTHLESAWSSLGYVVPPKPQQLGVASLREVLKHRRPMMISAVFL